MEKQFPGFFWTEKSFSTLIKKDRLGKLKKKTPEKVLEFDNF